MDKEKYEFHILTLTNDHLRMTQLLVPEINVHSLHLNKQKIKTVSGLYRGFHELVNFLLHIKADIIQTHLAAMPLLFIAAAIKYSKVDSLHIRTVHTAGLFFEDQMTLSNKLKLFADKIAMKLIKTHLISVSNTVYKNNHFHFKNIAEDITLIPNGVDLQRFDKHLYTHIVKENFGFKQDYLLVSYVARLDYGKNHDFLIEIWSEIIKEVPNAILCFAGDGVLKETLKQKAQEYHLEKKIIFLGSINTIPELLSVSDLAVFPSSFEGFGLVMIEKFAMKLPIVASDIASFKEIATHNKNAFLVSIEDKNKFISSILTLCKNQLLREQMGENAYQVAKKFSIENTIRLLDAYYTKCITKKFKNRNVF